jgi:hypothetical protein
MRKDTIKIPKNDPIRASVAESVSGNVKIPAKWLW